MSEQAEAKPQVKNLERIGTSKYPSYEAAKQAQASVSPKTDRKITKVKVIARADGTFDVAWYAKVLDPTLAKMQTAESKAGVRAAFEATPAEMGKAAVHGQKSKDRKKSPKSPR